jgi:hypothetical protein
MTLWQLFVLISGGASFGGAWTAAQRAENTQFVFAVVGAVIIAFGCAAVLHVLGGRVLRRLVTAYDSNEQQRSIIDVAGRATYLFAVGWCFASYFLGYWLTSLFVDFLR